MALSAEIKLLVELGRDGRVPRVERSPGPVGHGVEVRVRLGGELGLAALDERRASRGVDLNFFFYYFFFREKERGRG